MNFADLDDYVAKTAKNYDDQPHPTVAYAAMSMAGEAGEVVELVKKSWQSGRPPDPVLLCLELGDVLWYLTRAAHKTNVSIEQLARVTYEKLKMRAEQGKNPRDEYRMASKILFPCKHEHVRHVSGSVESVWCLTNGEEGSIDLTTLEHDKCDDCGEIVK